MTGALVWKAAPGPHARAVLVLERGELVFDDPRQFGRIDLGDRVERLGPDALAITAEEFAARLAGRRGRIKPLLLNQRILSGVGNIYADESLYRARIHPRALASRLSPARIERLCAALHEVLASAVASGGSSISDYRDGDGNPGAFQFEHRVYGREGEPCAACGTPIRRIVIAQRSAHYCPKCQRA
jgi:formamidopyrimidine-DNA glycosylase